MQQDGYDYGSNTVERLRDALVRTQTHPLDQLDQQIEALLKDPPSREFRTRIFDESSLMPPPISGAMLLELIRDHRNVLPEIDVSMLMCAGAGEKWRSVASVEYMAELIPDARFELFKESGHCLTIEEPEKFNQEVRNFSTSLLSHV